MGVRFVEGQQEARVQDRADAAEERISSMIYKNDSSIIQPNGSIISMTNSAWYGICEMRKYSVNESWHVLELRHTDASTDWRTISAMFMATNVL